MRRLRRGTRTGLSALLEQTGPAGGPVRILGLDPGSVVTGYAVLDCLGADSRYIASGGIRTSGASFPERLQQIFHAVSTIMREYRPEEVAVERVFMHRNPDSALKLGQARGAALSATFTGSPTVFEYAPREVKLAIVGVGSADKAQVALMVRRLLRLNGTLGADATDALAIALCHAHARRTRRLLASSGVCP